MISRTEYPCYPEVNSNKNKSDSYWSGDTRSLPPSIIGLRLVAPTIGVVSFSRRIDRERYPANCLSNIELVLFFECFSKFRNNPVSSYGIGDLPNEILFSLAYIIPTKKRAAYALDLCAAFDTDVIMWTVPKKVEEEILKCSKKNQVYLP